MATDDPTPETETKQPTGVAHVIAMKDAIAVHNEHGDCSDLTPARQYLAVMAACYLAVALDFDVSEAEGMHGDFMQSARQLLDHMESTTPEEMRQAARGVQA